MLFRSDDIIAFLYRLSTERLRRDLHRRIFGDLNPITYELTDFDIVMGVIHVG